MRVLIAIACLASMSQARQARFEEQEQPKQSLSSFLLAGNPALAGATGVAPKTTQNLARPAVEMAERKFGAPAKLNLPKKKYVGITQAKTRSSADVKFDVRTLGGFTEPTGTKKGDTNWLKNVDPYGLGYFDPWGYTIGASEAQIRTYREAELKHGRIAMLAALGFFVGETYHPLFDGTIDGASVYALQKSWAYESSVFIVPLLLVATFEFINAAAVFNAFGKVFDSGDSLAPVGLTFDPLGLSPKDPEAFKEMRTKELNNGRLAMIAIAGLFTQEAITGEPIFR
jgi:hypothetical protein